MTLSPDSIIVATQSQVSVDLGEEVAILGMGTGQYYGVRDVAARVWSLIQEPVSIAAVATRLEGEYDVAAVQLKRDLLEFVQALVREGLVTVRTDRST